MSSSKGFQNDDDAQLAAMGHKAELNRNFSMLYACFSRSLSLSIKTLTHHL